VVATYTLDEVLCEDAEAALYRARAGDGHLVLAKSLKAARPTSAEYEALRHELEAARQARTDAVVEPEAVTTVEGRATLVLSDDGAVPLARMLGTPAPLGSFFDLALALTDAVGALHSAHTIHGRLHPADVLVRRDGRAELIGLAPNDASVLQRDPSRFPSAMLPYLSPEQAGGLSMRVDDRTDLYSLGVIFYELLTGERPFVARDLVGWVHAHCALAPRAPSDRVAVVPDVVSRIVLKLLAKAPEARYQSAAALRRDLSRAREAVAMGVTAAFALGADDLPPRLRRTSRVYGRNEELALLERIVARVSVERAMEVVLVGGPSGVGTTALAVELRRALGGYGGRLFGMGRCESGLPDAPSSAVYEALDGALDALLESSDAPPAEVRRDLAERLDVNAPLLCALLPGLARVLPGRASGVPPDAPLAEAEHRAAVALGALVKAIARGERTVVIVIDDIDQIDRTSAEVLVRWASELRDQPLVILGTHREDAGPAGHRLRDTIDRIAAAGASVTRVPLRPLPPDDVKGLVADVVQRPPEEVAPLARLVADGSRGVPFAVTRLLERLHREGHLRYAVAAKTWRWDVAAAAGICAADPRALVEEAIEALPEPARDALSRLAAHGAGADLDALAIVLERPEREALSTLDAAFAARLLERSGAQIRFVHETVRDVAYERLGGARRATHLAIGRAFLAAGFADRHASRAFEVLRHFREVSPTQLSPAERPRVAELGLAAGRRAQETAHLVSSTPCIRFALALLDEEHWHTNHALAFALHLALAKSIFATEEPRAAETVARALLPRARRAGEVAAVYALLVELAFAAGRAHEATRACLDGLAAFGVTLPEHPTDREVDAATARALARLEALERPFSELPPASDPDARAVCDLLAALAAPSVYTDWNLVWLAAAASIDRSLTFGNAASSAVAYAILGLRLAARGDHERGFRLGEEAYRLARRDENVAHRPKAALVFLAFLSFLSLRVRDALDVFRHEVEIARSLGDRTHAAYLQRNAAQLRFFAGDPLGDVSLALDEALALSAHADSGALREELASMKRLVDRLRGVPGADEELPPLDLKLQGRTLPIVAIQRWYDDVVASVILGDYAGAVDAAARVERASSVVVGAIEEAEVHFYVAVAVAASMPDRARALAIVRSHLEALRRLASGAPPNFGAREAAVAAEADRLAGDEAAAERGYEAAIRAARASGSVLVEAIASECAARFHRGRDAAIADGYVAQARNCYEAWGATRKVRALDAEHPNLSARPKLSGADVESILEAQRAIASQLRLSDLQARLLALAIEHAGAQRGCLLMPSGGTLLMCEVGGARCADFGESGAPADPARVPLSLCRTALRLRRPIVLVDAVEGNRFAVDPYFVSTRARSVLCLPIVRADEATALLYLEHDVAAGVFTSARLAVLESIAAQAAISLEKARRISQLEAEVNERRRVEARLAANEQLLEEIIDAMPVAIFVKDAQGRYVLLNRKCEEVLHVGRRALVGKDDRDFFPPEVAERFRASDALAMEGRTIVEDEALALDAGHHTFSTVTFPLYDVGGRPRAVCGVATDVTARRRADEEIRRSLSLLEATLESTADGILVVSREGKIVRHNRQFAELWGLSQEVLKSGDEAGVMTSVLDQLDDPSAFLARVHELHAEPIASSDDTLHLKDGRIIERRSRPQRVGDEVVGRVWSFRDVTTRVRALEERDRLLAEETRARAQAEEAVRVRNEFLSVASHELRTPLASLALAVDGLEQVFLGVDAAAPSRRALGIARRQVKRLTVLIGLLLDVSRIRAGKLALVPTEVDLSAVVRDVTALLADELARAGCTLVLRADEPVVGRWDGPRLEQVVHNLVSNAMKFGGGRPITVTVARRDDAAELSVADQGIGISEDFQKYLFAPFSRGVSARHYGGLGLGLYITKTIVEAHGGSLRVESKEGAGARFIVTLPMGARSP
jgi:PAS domain S-box-containing protein